MTYERTLIYNLNKRLIIEIILKNYKFTRCYSANIAPINLNKPLLNPAESSVVNIDE